MAEVKNLDILAEQIYQEGIEKAKKESGEIIKRAEAKAKEILDDAEAQAREHQQKAEKEAERLKTSANNEVQTKARQAVSDLKLAIENLLTTEVLDKPAKETFEKEDFIKELMLKATDQWSQSGNVDIQLSDELASKIQKFLNGELKKKVPGLTVTPQENMKKGFVVEDREDGYYISFTDEDFSEFLKPYFSEHIQKLLFEKSS